MTHEINQWRSLQFVDPEIVLRRLKAVEAEIADWDLDDDIRRLRTPGLKKDREGRDAALFTYGLGLGKGVPMTFANFESSDYDFVTSWMEGTTQHFCPVQLKELVPADLNPNATIEELLRKQATGRPPSSTVLAIKLNRRGSANLESLTIPATPFSQMWFFWASSEGGKRWTLYGNALADPGYFSYDYPAP